jgi:enoyl-CoA hydratase/carnithine racemase
VPREITYEELDHVGLLVLNRPALGAWVSSSLGELFRTQDHKEGVAAFLEKREARYEGR